MKRRSLLGALPALGFAHGAAWAAQDGYAAERPPIRTDGTLLPEPGSYRLPRLFEAPEGNVLRSDGRPARLRDLLRGRLTVFSFMYTYCRDPLGCPLAWRTMEGLQAALQHDDELARASQLVSLSFDPSHDTPAAMRSFGHGREDDPRVRWRFLTTASVPELLPLLKGFGQEVSVETDARGRPTRTLNHMLKLFLVDAEAKVREVYSVATLAEPAVLGDLRTLQLERGR